jgi:hypothetical protein
MNSWIGMDKYLNEKEIGQKQGGIPSGQAARS